MDNPVLAIFLWNVVPGVSHASEGSVTNDGLTKHIVPYWMDSVSLLWHHHTGW